MIACVPVDGQGMVAPGWGRSNRVAVVSTKRGAITDWQEVDVGWDTLHDEGTDGAHHARVARFLIDRQIQMVIAEHMGDGMTRMLSSMGVPVALGAHGDARQAVLAATSEPA